LLKIHNYFQNIIIFDMDDENSPLKHGYSY
jgi:hypothetical protein